MFTYDLTDEDDELPYNRPGKSSSYFDLDDEVGKGRTKHRSDALKIETILGNTGDMDLEYVGGPTGLTDETLDTGLRAYQKRNGLKVDGWARPGGPTITKMTEQFGGLLGDYKAPSPWQSDTHHRMRDAGYAGFLKPQRQELLMPPIPGLPKPDDTILGANHSLVRTVRDDGMQDVAGWMAKRVRAGGDGVVEARNFVDQLEQLMPGEGTTAIRGILQRLADTPDLQRAFFGGPVIELAPVGVFEQDGPQRYEEALKTRPWEEYELGRRHRPSDERPPEPLGTHKIETPEEGARNRVPISYDTRAGTQAPAIDDGMLDPAKWPEHMRGQGQMAEATVPPTQDEEISGEATATDYADDDPEALLAAQAQQPQPGQQPRPPQNQNRQPQRPQAPAPAQPQLPQNTPPQVRTESTGRPLPPRSALTRYDEAIGSHDRGPIPHLDRIGRSQTPTDDDRARHEVFVRAARQLQGTSPIVQETLRHFWVTEGGDWIDRSKTAASSGIIESTYRGIAKSGRVADLQGIAAPGDIPTDRRPEVMRDALDQILSSAGGIGVLDRFGDQTVANAIASTVYYVGPKGGTAIREALIKTAGENPPESIRKIQSTGALRRDVVDEVERVLRAPENRDVFLENLANARVPLLAAALGKDTSKLTDGELEAINRYRPSRRGR
jgi:hypothetical protein